MYLTALQNKTLSLPTVKLNYIIKKSIVCNMILVKYQLMAYAMTQGHLVSLLLR